MPDFNVKLTQSAVSPPPNGSGISKPLAAPAEVQERTRTIAPLTQYNEKTGLVENDPASPWSGQAKPIEEKPVEKPADPAAPSRRDAWKAQQDKAKKDRDTKAAEELEKRQPLARDFLRKGDMAGAAKALGMTTAEFREYAQNVLLTMPTPDKELTPEQKLEQDRENVRKGHEDLTKRQQQLEYAITADRYIRDNIRPVMADKEKYEFISQRNSSEMEAYVYRFMDEHFRKTKEELKVADVLDGMEAHFEKEAVAQYEKHKGLKKFAKVLGASRGVTPSEAPAEPGEQLSVESEPEPQKAPPPRQPVKVEVSQPRQNGRVPFAMMTREERLAALREEDEQNPRA